MIKILVREIINVAFAKEATYSTVSSMTAGINVMLTDDVSSICSRSFGKTNTVNKMCTTICEKVKFWQLKLESGLIMVFWAFLM